MPASCDWLIFKKSIFRLNQNGPADDYPFQQGITPPRLTLIFKIFGDAPAASALFPLLVVSLPLLFHCQRRVIRKAYLLP